MTEIRTFKSSALQSTEEGLSGASRIGVPPITGLPPEANNVETALAELAANTAPPPPAASETVAGVVELATSAEASAGTDTTRAVHPAGLKAAITPEAWTAPTLVNSWVNFGAPWEVAGYRKTPWGEVQLRGVIKSGTTANQTTIFTLPAGYRPANNRMFSVPQGGNTHARVSVLSDGIVQIAGVVDNTFLGLDGVRFDI